MKTRTLRLIAGLALICVWQMFLIPRSVNLDETYRDRGTSGLYFSNYQKFYYLYHHLGLFPVAAEAVPTENSKEGALRYLEKNGANLVNEIHHTVRSGERGKILLFVLDGLIRGDSTSARTRPFHIALFIISLMCLWGSFFRVGHPALGALSVLFLGSNPFQLAEVYRSSNIFGLSGSIGILLLAGAIPLIYRKSHSLYGFFYLVATALVMGTVAVIRPEPLPMFISALGAFFFFAPHTIYRRIAGVALATLLFFCVSAGWNAYFDSKTKQAVELVASKGGYPYPDFRYAAHRFWHPLYIGLGDFDGKYGHQWNDLQAYELAAEILGEQSDNYPYRPGSFILDRFHDAKSHYAVKWEDLPEYNELMKNLFWERVLGDPLWYAGILVHRVGRVLNETTPLSIQLLSYKISVPWPGWIWLFVLGIALYRRKKTDLAFLLFLLPICATTILVYSGDGRSFYSIYHLLAAPVLLVWLGETNYVRDIWRKFHAWNPAR